MAIKQGLIAQLRQEKEQKLEQQRLKDKHQIADESVIVVEKSNTVKFLIRTVTALLRFLALASILFLATTGLTALLYTPPREELLKIFAEVWHQIASVLG